MRLWCRDAGIELVDTVIALDSDRGIPARQRPHLLETAFNAGKALVTKPSAVTRSQTI